MRERSLGIFGVGMVTERVADIAAFARVRAVAPAWREAMGRAGKGGADVGAGQDVLCQLALRAMEQAWGMASMGSVQGEPVGLIVQTAWGTIDSTRAYLESMLEAEGKYASPRHFSRSVYSSVASVAAIHFGIRGPCETLAFDEGPLLGALMQAWRLLAMKRCERVVVVWCEQAGELAADLAKRAAEGLGRREFARYAGGLGFGAVAMVCGLEGGVGRLGLEEFREEQYAMGEGIGRAFAMDGAVGLVGKVMGGEI